MKLQQARSNGAWWRPSMKASRVGALAVLAVMAMMPVVGQAPADRSESQNPKAQPLASPAAGANLQAQRNEQEAGKPVPEAESGERKNPMVEDSARLLQMATDLKAEVDRTTKDMLSMQVIRKAGEIEKLAHSVRENKRPIMIGAK